MTLQDWQEGADHFNARRYWHAHESWERGWLKLPLVEKLHIQALIQATGAFHLIGIGRLEPARALASRALEKMKQRDSEGDISSIFPRVEIPGLVDALVLLRASEPSSLPECLSGFSLHASLLLSPA